MVVILLVFRTPRRKQMEKMKRSGEELERGGVVFQILAQWCTKGVILAVATKVPGV